MAKHRVRDIEDEPMFEPMHGLAPSTDRRAPSTDQKRIRRQMAHNREQSMQNATQKTARSDENNWGVFGPNSDAKVFGPVTKERAMQKHQEMGSPQEYYVGTQEDPNEIAESNRSTWEDPSTAYPYGRDTRAAKDSSISPRQREVDLLQAMAAAGSLDTQRRLAADLESLRAEQVRESRRLSTLQFDGPVPESRWEHNANPATLRTSMASDWLMDVPEPNHTAMERDQKMVAEASLWYTRTPQEVREDRAEFDIQAIGMARYQASQFGEDATGAQATFLDHVSHLAGHRVANDMLTTPNNDTITTPPVETAPMDDVNAPADTGSAEVDHSSPSDNPSLSEGNEPAGDGGGAPVSDSAAANNAGDSGDATPTVDNRPANPTVLPESGVAKSQAKVGPKRQALMQRMAVAWGRRHYEDLASTISTHPESNQLAKHFADHLMGTNPNYRRDQFQQAASTKGGYQIRGGTGTANYSRGHFQHIANAIASYPGDKSSVANHFANHFAATSPRFDKDRFIKATQAMTAPKAAAVVEDPAALVDPNPVYEEPTTPTPPAEGYDSMEGSPWGGEANDEEMAYNSPPRVATYGNDIAGTPWSGEANDQANHMQYQVSFTHPSGAKHSETVAAPSPEHAVQKVRNQFKNADEASLANWKVDVMNNPWSGKANDESIRNNSTKRTAAAPEPDGLNAGVDFQPESDPATSVSLGPGEEGEWPAAPDGDPQTMTNPTTAAIYDVTTDLKVGAASVDHELACQASTEGTCWVDGDLMVISAHIVGEDYVTDPVREVYVGAED